VGEWRRKKPRCDQRRIGGRWWGAACGSGGRITGGSATACGAQEEGQIGSPWSELRSGTRRVLSKWAGPKTTRGVVGLSYTPSVYRIRQLLIIALSDGYDRLRVGMWEYDGLGPFNMPSRLYRFGNPMCSRLGQLLACCTCI
jgi:hypothetical protein